MKTSQLDTECIKANSSWAAIDVITVRQAFEDAYAGAVDLIKTIDGYPTVMTIDKWMNLEWNGEEDFIMVPGHEQENFSARHLPVPRACVCTNYRKQRAKEVPFNLRNLARRYGYVCAVTDKPLTEEEYSREHKVPKSLGGKSGWGNEVLMDRRTNNKRGNRPYEEMGLKEPTILGAPPPLLPVNSIINRNGYPEWDLFLIRR